MGIAKEQARVFLPEGLTVSRMYMAGTLRSWIHYCALRRGNGTQKEHKIVADACWNQLLTTSAGLRKSSMSSITKTITISTGRP
jgi:thymidylate synthase ThyX